MKALFRHVVTVLLLFAPLPGFAADGTGEAREPEHPLKPFLWKVEGGDLEKPSWLFGTIHLGSGPLGTLHPAARRALDGSDAVFTELPMDMATQMGLTKHLLRDDDQTLREAIGKELAKRLAEELAAINPQLDLSFFDSFKTWAVGMTLPMLKAQLSGAQALDAVIWNHASEAGKITGALEKPADQFGIFDALKEEEQIVFLSESLRAMREAREAGEDPLDELIQAYISGEDERLNAEMERHIREMRAGEHADLGKRLTTQLIDDRNAAMAATIGEKLAAHPGRSQFFAVGAAHYLGDGNIGERLAERGFTVTRITE